MNALAFSDRPFTADDKRIADRMSSYWANFAATGDPNGTGLPHWPSVAEKPDMTMNVGDTLRADPTGGQRREAADAAVAAAAASAELTAMAPQPTRRTFLWTAASAVVAANIAQHGTRREPDRAAM